MPTCRSSGVLTANAVVNAGRCKLISIHATYTGTTAEFDMHGVLALNGLYLQISTGTGTGAAVSVEFT